MRIVEINSVPYGSTGKIMFEIADLLTAKGNEVLCGVGYTHLKSKRKNCLIISGIFTKTLHILLSKITGKAGQFSYFSTKRFLRKLDKFKPDVIHLHNLHGWFINLPLLFNYIKNKKVKVVWTLHDCWAFTGHCPHFTYLGCNKWQTGCFSCPQYKAYPGTFVDKSKKVWGLKKAWFTGVKDLTIVTPSSWLSNLVKQSFLKEYPVKVINNGINLEVFKPVENDFRKAYNIKEKYLLLGVSYVWDNKKGLDVFIELSKRLDKNDYKIILVGVDKKLARIMPSNILAIEKTQNQRQLAEIYSACDLFVNPTREENYPTVNMESLACDTPVLTFNTGGSPEIIDGSCGSVVEYGNVEEMLNEIIRICTKKPFERQACLDRAKIFDVKDRFKEYVELITKE